MTTTSLLSSYRKDHDISRGSNDEDVRQTQVGFVDIIYKAMRRELERSKLLLSMLNEERSTL